MEDRDRLVPRHPTRREAIAIGVGAFVVAAVPLARSRRTKLVRRSVPVMGTVGEVGVVHHDARFAHSAIDAAIRELRLVERLMTRFTETSDIGRANRLASQDAVTVSPVTAMVVEEALLWAESSDGAFDPCLGKVAELWDVANRRVPPASGDIRPLAGRQLYKGLDLGRDRVRFTERDIALDLGGIGKGYGVDRAVQALREHGVEHGLVNVGGDLYAMGMSEDDDPWKVGIRSPDDPTTLTGKIEVSDAAVATSGDYLRYFTHDGRRYHHLLDAATGAPRHTDRHSVTVRAHRCITADAAATAAFSMTPADAAQLLRSHAPDAELV
jgi:thiamine biosynthesis lipoprotein